MLSGARDPDQRSQRGGVEIAGDLPGIEQYAAHFTGVHVAVAV